MRSLPLFLTPYEAYCLLNSDESSGLRYFCSGQPDAAWSYPAGLLLAKTLQREGLELDFTPPATLSRALYDIGFRDWHLLSDDVVYALHLANREDHPSFLVGEVLRRRRSELFRGWRKAQRVAEWARQRVLGAFGLLEVA